MSAGQEGGQRPPILLLAAGAATRMAGPDKLMLPIRGQPLIRDRALTALAAGGDVYVALPDLDHPRARALSDLPVTPVPVPEAARGLSASLRAGLAALPPAQRLMILLADLPDITADDIRAVLAAARALPGMVVWRGTDADGRPGHPILIDALLRDDFAALTGDQGGSAILARHAARTRMVPLPGRHATCDIDTAQDWADWQRDTLS